jgi:hypothetical protein
MKKTLFIFLLLASAFPVFSQEIADVRNENNQLVVYDSRGERVSSMPGMNKRVVAITGEFFVTGDGTFIATYNAGCSRLGSMLSTGKTVLGTAGSNFTVEENGFTVTYDSTCSRVSSIDHGNSQEIADVRTENSMIVVYNAQGRKISFMFSSPGKQVVAKTGTFFVVQDDFHIETYDVQCNRIGSMSSLNKIVRNAAGSTFTVEENEWIATYDSKCNRVNVQVKK